MIALLKTAERTNHFSYLNNYVFQRHLFAYISVPPAQLLNKKIMELGCGEGYGMQMLSAKAQYYLALDKKRPSDRFFNKNITFNQYRFSTLLHLPDNSFDTIICFQVIEHIKNDNKLLNEIKRVLKPGGNLLLSTPNKLTSLARNPFHIREYTPGEIDKLMAAHFTHYTIKGIYGNNLVMEYYRENKKYVGRLMKYDIFNLQYRLPVFLLKIPYSLCNNINRLNLLNKIGNVAVNIEYSDFYFGDVSGDCLDYYISAFKPG